MNCVCVYIYIYIYISLGIYIYIYIPSDCNFPAWPFNDQWSNHIETSQLIWKAKQLTVFYMMGTLFVKGLMCKFQYRKKRWMWRWHIALLYFSKHRNDFPKIKHFKIKFHIYLVTKQLLSGKMTLLIRSHQQKKLKNLSG